MRQYVSCRESISKIELLLKAFSDLIGKKSIQYVNGTEGRKRRYLMDEGFSQTAVAYYYDDFVKVQRSLFIK